MKSIGNDIIALNAIDVQRSTNPAFYSKFIADSELALYQQDAINGLDLAHFIWLLWSVKESAYKCLKRGNEELTFAPVKFIVHSLVSTPKPIIALNSVKESNNDIFYSGELLYGINQLFFFAIITQQYIATVACEDPLFENLHWDINTIENTGNGNQSTSVREFALSKVQSVSKYKHPQIVKTSAGVPVIFDDDVQSDIPISLTHHGNFVSYAFYYSSLKV